MNDTTSSIKIISIILIFLFIIISGYIFVSMTVDSKERSLQEQKYNKYIDQGYSVYADGVLIEPKAINISDYTIEFSVRDKSIYLKKENKDSSNIIFFPVFQ